MIQHQGPISGIATFNNEYVATAGYDNQIILWDAKSQQALARALHDHLANQCVFSADGKLLASASSDYTARIWHIPDLHLIAVCASHNDDVEMVTFHPKQPLVATASRDHNVRVFRFDGSLQSICAGHLSDVISVEWASSESLDLISSGDDGSIRVWDGATGIQKKVIDLGQIETDTLVIAPNGIIYAGNDDGEIIIIKENTRSLIKAHSAGIKRISLSKNARWCVSISYDRTIKLWDVDFNGKLSLQDESSLPPQVWPRSAAFLNDSQIVFGSFGTTYAVYNFETKKWNTSKIQNSLGLNSVTGFQSDIYAVGDSGEVFKNGKRFRDLGSLCNFLLPFGNYLLAGGQLGAVFDVTSGKKIYQHRSPLNCGAVFSYDGSQFAVVGSYTGEALVLKILENGRFVFDRKIALHKNAIKGIACNENMVFSVCADTSVAVHRTSDFSCVRHVSQAHSRIANGCVALENGNFASISRDKKLRIWSSNLQPRSFNTPHTHSIKCIAASQNYRYIATASYNGFICVFDLQKEKWIFQNRFTSSGISSLCAMPQTGNRFLASSYNGNIYEFEIPGEC